MRELWPLKGGGTLRMREEEPWVCLEAVRPADGQGLYKVWCSGTGGEFLLGTLTPQDGRLYLARRVSRKSLQEAGAWPLTGGKAVMVYRFTEPGEGKTEGGPWQQEPYPETWCRDPVIKSCLMGTTGILRRNEGNVIQLAAPFSTCKPISLNTLFCLAEVMQWHGRRYLVWSFDKQGWPVLPERVKKREI